MVNPLDTFNTMVAATPLQLAAVAFTVTVAYVIFGLAGFGTALVAGPVLAHFLPLSAIVPLLALLDFGAAVANVSRDRKAADLDLLKMMVPGMIIGSLIGAGLLLYGRPRPLLQGLGVFAVAYALYSLSGFKPARKFTRSASVPFSLVGGVFSALFGSGGFIYSIYLTGRLEKPEHIRVTQSTLIGVATLTRAILFLASGVYFQGSILVWALVFLIPMLFGTYVGRHLTLKFSRQGFLRIISGIVLASGLSLIVRFFIES